MIKENQYKGYKNLIVILSFAIPIVVAVLLGVRQKVYLGEWTKVLPHFIGAINTLTSILLVFALYFVRQKQFKKHENTMIAAFISGSVFLVMYVLYHLTNESTHFGGEGLVRYSYFFLLISHIVLSIGVVPLVLQALFFGITNQFDDHKKVVKFAYPIWLYVSITGVIVYLMIMPYYK